MPVAHLQASFCSLQYCLRGLLAVGHLCRQGLPMHHGLRIQVFCDASGFTALTEALDTQPNGAERLGGVGVLEATLFI